MMNENAAIEWQKKVSQTAQTTLDGMGCPDHLLALQQGRRQWDDGLGQDPETTRILSHSALTVIVAFSILRLVSVDLLPTLSHTWHSFMAIGSLLMIAAVLAHIKC